MNIIKMKTDQRKTKQELIVELSRVREKLSALETSDRTQLHDTIRSVKANMTGLVESFHGLSLNTDEERNREQNFENVIFSTATILLSGTAKLPESGSTLDRTLLVIEMAVHTSMAKVVAIHCEGLGMLAQQMLVELIQEKDFPEVLPHAIAQINQRYFAPDKRAVIAALRDLQKRYDTLYNQKQRTPTSNGTTHWKNESNLYTPPDGERILKKLESLNAVFSEKTRALNNMLAVITGLTSVIRDELAPTDPIHKDIAEIILAAEQSSQIVKVDLGMMQSKSASYESSTLSLTERIQRAVASLPADYRTRVKWTMDNQIESKIISGFDEFEGVFLNLVKNALEASEAKKDVEIKVEEIEINKESRWNQYCGLIPDNYIYMTIQDQGSGMDEINIANAYEPFYSSKVSKSNLGLGLTVAYGIIKRLGGTIAIESEIGQGTRVCVFWPARTEAESVRNQIAKEIHLPDFDGATVLLIDDEDSVRAMGQRLLERLGCQVLLAPDGALGLELFRKYQKRIQLVILDMVMPGMHGVRCIEEIKKIDTEIPVVVSTGLTERTTEKKEIAKFAVVFLDKPFDIQKLERVLKRFLSTEQDDVKP